MYVEGLALIIRSTFFSEFESLIYGSRNFVLLFIIRVLYYIFFNIQGLSLLENSDVLSYAIILFLSTDISTNIFLISF